MTYDNHWTNGLFMFDSELSGNLNKKGKSTSNPITVTGISLSSCTLCYTLISMCARTTVLSYLITIITYKHVHMHCCARFILDS